MNRTEFIIATAVILFVAFALGWFASWLVNRFTRVTKAEIGELDQMAQALHEAEETRDQAITYLQQREAEIHVRQRFAFDQSADADRRPTLLQFHRAQPKAVARHHRRRSRRNVGARLLGRPDPAIPDEVRPRRLVDQLDDKRGVSRGQVAQAEAVGFEDVHGG